MSPDVTVIIFHPEAGPTAGPLTRVVTATRAAAAERHRTGFLAAGASRARVIGGPPDDVPFGARLRAIARESGQGGLVVLGSGAIPAATASDRRAFVAAASGRTPRALTNSRYSADIVAIADARAVLCGVPDLQTDNALPRWLEEIAGIPVDDLRGRWRLAIDIDGPLDILLLGGRWSRDVLRDSRHRIDEMLSRLRAVARDRNAELIVTGRTSSSAVRWLERHTAARVRALIEERGLRTSVPGQRPPASVLGAHLERDGPASIGEHLARLGEGALVDSRVLLAHRLGADTIGWPTREDRFAADLLLHERIADPWLRDLTAGAATAPIPVVLGGHSLVGPGVRLAFRAPRAGADG